VRNIDNGPLPYYETTPTTGRTIEILQTDNGFTSGNFTFDPETHLATIITIVTQISGGELVDLDYNNLIANTNIFIEASGVGGNVGGDFAGSIQFTLINKFFISENPTVGIFTPIHVQNSITPVEIFYNRWVPLTIIMTRTHIIGYYDRAFAFSATLPDTLIHEFYNYRIIIQRTNVEPRAFVGGMFVRQI
jgi:hypothetical protein